MLFIEPDFSFTPHSGTFGTDVIEDFSMVQVDGYSNIYINLGNQRAAQLYGLSQTLGGDVLG
jgi:hypothetical protein